MHMRINLAVSDVGSGMSLRHSSNWLYGDNMSGVHAALKRANEDATSNVQEDTEQTIVPFHL